MNLHLSTYPRSGQHFFRSYIQQTLEVPHIPLKFSWSHDLIFKDFDKIITVIRDPKECIASYVSMTLYYEDLSPLRNKQDISFYIDAAKLEYVSFASYALDRVHHIYGYEDVINKIDKVILDLHDKLNLDDTNYKIKTEQNSFRNDIMNKIMMICPEFPCNSIGNHTIGSRKIFVESKDKPAERHLVSSKKTKYYEDVFSILNNQNLNQIYEKYNSIKNKIINIT